MASEIYENRIITFDAVVVFQILESLNNCISRGIRVSEIANLVRRNTRGYQVAVNSLCVGNSSVEVFYGPVLIDCNNEGMRLTESARPSQYCCVKG